MATRRRDYRAEEARRNAKAQALGWRSHGARRYAKEKFSRTNLELKAHWSRFLMTDKGKAMSKDEEERAFRAFYLGIVNPKTNMDKSVGSAKAEWFVEWWESVASYDVWYDKYVRHRM